MTNEIVSNEYELSLCEYHIKSLDKNKIQELFPKAVQLSRLPLENYDNLNFIYNEISKKYSFSQIQAIIRKNDCILPLMIIACDRADKNSMKDKNFIDNVIKFFDIENKKYKSLLKSSNFHRIINEYYNPLEKKLNDKDLRDYLSLLCKNGYSDGLFIVKQLFQNSFEKYTSVIEEQNNNINQKKNEEKYIVSTLCNDEFFKNLNDKVLSAWDKNSSKNFIDLLRNCVGRDQIDLYKKFCKNYKKQINDLELLRKEINAYKKNKKEARSIFKKEEDLYFQYFFEMINNQIFYDKDFNIDEIQQTFIQMCQNLWNCLGKYGEDEVEIYNQIKNSLDGVIPGLLYYSQNYVPKDNTKSRYYQYCRLNSLYQSFYKFTSDENIKIQILTDYENSSLAPIPFEIIEDGLDMNKFSNLKDRKLIIRCIEKIYEKIKECKFLDSCDNDLIQIRLTDINLKAIYHSLDLPEDVREYAFNWYFSKEDDVSKKIDFCWKIIEELDKKQKRSLMACDNRIYSKCRDFLIDKAKDDDIRYYLKSFINSSESKGLIIDFVVGYSSYDTSFSGEKEKYKSNLRTRDPDIDFDVSISSAWKNR